MPFSLVHTVASWFSSLVSTQFQSRLFTYKMTAMSEMFGKDNQFGAYLALMSFSCAYTMLGVLGVVFFAPDSPGGPYIPIGSWSL